MVNGFVTKKELDFLIENNGDIDKDELIKSTTNAAKELLESDVELGLGECQTFYLYFSILGEKLKLKSNLLI